MSRILHIDNCAECKFWEEDPQEIEELWGHTVCWNPYHDDNKDNDEFNPVIIDGTVGIHEGCPLPDTEKKRQESINTVEAQA